MNDTTKTSRPYPAQAWRMPPLSTAFLCDDAVFRTLGEMIAGCGDGFVPKSDEDVLMVLDRYGADWTSPVVDCCLEQRDRLMAKLSDPDRYRGDSDFSYEVSGMHWVHDNLVNQTIGQFVSKWLPDAHDWENSCYNVTSLDGREGMVYRVETDIPTIDDDCWISFEIATPNLNDEPMVLFFQALRSDANGTDVTTYECTDMDAGWVEVDT